MIGHLVHNIPMVSTTTVFLMTKEKVVHYVAMIKELRIQNCFTACACFTYISGCNSQMLFIDEWLWSMHSQNLRAQSIKQVVVVRNYEIHTSTEPANASDALCSHFQIYVYT